MQRDPLATFDPGTSPGPGNLGQKRHYVHPYVYSARMWWVPETRRFGLIGLQPGGGDVGFGDAFYGQVSTPGDKGIPQDRSECLEYLEKPLCFPAIILGTGHALQSVG